MVQAEPFNAEAPPEALTTDITATPLHYVRSNFALPAHDGVLHVGGAVDQDLSITLDDLRAMPSLTRVVTMECAGNGRDLELARVVLGDHVDALEPHLTDATPYQWAR